MGRAFMVLGALALAASPALGQETVKVNASTLNVRSGPGTGYSKIGEVYAGQLYVQIGTSSGWRKIWFASTTGWVYGSYASVVTGTEAKVTASSLNVRTGPGTGYSSVGTAPGGSWWVIVGSSGSWRKIYWKGAARWVYGSYLSTSGGGTTTTTTTTSSAGFVQLPASGSGYYAYSSSDRRWGVPAMVYKLINAAGSWKSQHSTWPRIGVGDISLKYGGPMSGHASHQVGKDVDIRPVRTSGEGPTSVGWSSYSGYRTKDWITHHVKLHMNVKVIFFNDPNVYNPLSYVQYWPNHFNHMHVRIW